MMLSASAGMLAETTGNTVSSQDSAHLLDEGSAEAQRAPGCRRTRALGRDSGSRLVPVYVGV